MTRRRNSLWHSLLTIIPVASMRPEGGTEHTWDRMWSRRPLDNIFADIPENRRANGRSLFSGNYTTSSDVQDIIELGYDVAAMERAEDITGVEDVYRDGRESNTIDSHRITLASLSLTATEMMLDETQLTIYRHAFSTKGLQNGEESGYFKGQESQFYADAIISDLFQRNITGVQSEAVLVLNVWMATVHELNKVLISCNSNYNSSAAAISLDRAAAFWAGADDGSSLYQLAQSAAENFGQFTEGRAWVNVEIENGLTSLQSYLLNGSTSCSRDDSSASMELRDSISRVIDVMSVPLIQNLIHHALSGESHELAQVYLSAVLPHVLACDPNLASALDIPSFDFVDNRKRASWVRTLQKAFSCVRLGCDDIGQYTLDPTSYRACQEDSDLLLAGYELSSPEAISYSRIDRDLTRLEILLSGGAERSGVELYRYGYFAPFSLQELAVNDVLPRAAGSLFDLYRFYFETESYGFVDEEVALALRRGAEFENSTTDEMVAVVIGLLSYEASFLSVMSALTTAASACEASVNEDGAPSMTAIEYWDIGAALYIGSIEEGIRGGQDDGRLLHAASKRLCSLFGTCFESSSKTNNLVVEAFILGKHYLSQRNCAASKQLVQDFIFPALQSILIQGTMAYGAASAFGDLNPEYDGRGAGHAFARAILPQVHEANNESALVIETTLLLPYIRDVSLDGFYDAMGALYAALPQLATDCQNVGQLQTPALSLCKSIEQQRPPNSIAFGRYVFSNPKRADHIASIALDIRDMKQNVSMQEALQIYNEGRNSFLASDFRNATQISLASFSLEGSTFMSEDPLFNIYKFALYEDEVFETDQTIAFTFADDYVQEIFATSQDVELAAESAVVLNLWMMIAHHLYSAVRACAVKGNAEFNVDSAVALWIGKQEAEGSSSDEGWLFYSIAQDAARGFGHEDKEATTNTHLIEAFNSIKDAVRPCSNENDAHLKVRSEVDSILRILSVPLMQQLFIAMAANDQARVALYARSVIPQCAGCDPTAHSELSRFFMEDFSGERSVGKEVIYNIAVLLRCLKMPCEDFDYTETAPDPLKELVSKVCTALSVDEDSVASMFSDPTTFLSTSRIDLDMLQIGIFMRTRAYEAALDWYQHGHNALLLDGVDGETKLITLQKMANLQSEKPVKHWNVHSDYHGSDRQADELVLEALQQEGVYQNASRVQLAVGVSTALQAVISYQGITWNLEQATSSCKQEEDSVAALQYWTTAIALFTGSIGLSSSNANRGVAFRAIGGELCQDFGTCTEEGGSLSNVALYDAFSEGYGFLDAKKCTETQELIQSTIIPHLQVPLIQGTLKCSIAFNSDNALVVVRSILQEKEADESLSGYVLAQAILPFVANVNATSAETIDSFFGSSPLDRDGDIGDSYYEKEKDEEAESIWEAFRSAIPEMGIDCTWVGVYVSVVVNDDQDNMSSSSALSLCPSGSFVSSSPGTIGTGGPNIIVSSRPPPGVVGAETTNSSGLSPGAVTGIVLGTIIAAIAIVAAGLFLHRNKTRNRRMYPHRRRGSSTNLSIQRYDANKKRASSLAIGVNSLSSESHTSLDDINASSPETSDRASSPLGHLALSASTRFDEESVAKSYSSGWGIRLVGNSLSRNARRMLSRIVRYGDDASANGILRLDDGARSSDRQSSSIPDVFPIPKPIKKVSFYLFDDDSEIV